MGCRDQNTRGKRLPNVSVEPPVSTDAFKVHTQGCQGVLCCTELGGQQRGDPAEVTGLRWFSCSPGFSALGLFVVPFRSAAL